MLDEGPHPARGKDNFWGEGRRFWSIEMYCIRLCKQQRQQQHGAADLYAGATQFCSLRMDSPADGVTSAKRCGLSSKFFDH